MDAQGDRNWSHSFDIADKKQGTYNILVEGRDSAGNLSVAGPINVYVDPKSDLPVAVIANPLSGMRVSGDLNIVGTCVDDDGVSGVDLRIDSGEWVRASGGAFWSLYLRSGEIPDGRRTIEVRGVDVNGLEGPVHAVSFDMDSSRPGASVSAPRPGALVAGRIELKGVVTDDNAVVKVEYSLDGGGSWRSVKGKWDKRRKQYPFSAPIDTRTLPDGPLAVLIRAEDGVGSVGMTPTLFVVDNTRPTIAVLSPGPDEKVDRSFTLMGTVTDDVAVASLTWRSGKLGGDIALTPGDPHWSIPLELPSAKGKEAELFLLAVDTIGNKRELRVRLPLDLEADRPRITVLEPLTTEKTPAKTGGSVTISGYARDDDGIAAVEYRLEKGAPVRLETTGAFTLSLEGLAAGKRSVELWAVDLAGSRGPSVRVHLEDAGTAPTLRIAEVVYGAGTKDARSEAFVPGMELRPDAGASLRLESGGGLKSASLSYSFSGREPQTLAAKGASPASFLVPVPSSPPYGALEFSAELLDSGGRKVSVASHLYLTNYAAVRGEPGFRFVDERLEDDGTVRFGAGGEALSGRFVGAVPASVLIEGEAPGFRLSLEGDRVILEPPEQGVAGPVVLVARTDRGHEFRSRPLRLVADARGPELLPEVPASPYLGTEPLALTGRISDPSGPLALSYRILGPLGEALSSGEVPISEGSESFSLNLETASLPEGPLSVELAARDGAGNASLRTLHFFKDTSPPEVSFILSPDGPDGTTAAFYVRDSGGLGSVSYGRDGDFRDLEGADAFVVPIEGEGFQVRAVDRAGNERILPVPASEAGAALPSVVPGAPAVEILSPLAAAGRRTILLFRIASDAEPVQVSWSLGSKRGVMESGLLRRRGGGDGASGGVYTGAVVVEDYQAKAGPASAAVTVKNAAGKSALAKAAFSYDGGAAELPSLTVPDVQEGAVLGTEATVTALGRAPQGIASYTLVLDGKERLSAEGPGAASFALSGLSVGPHTIVLTATDRLGNEGPVVKRSFRVRGADPSIGDLRVQRKSGSAELLNGGTAVVDGGTLLSGTVRAPNGAPVVELRFGETAVPKVPVKRLAAGEFSFQVPVPKELPFGETVLTATARDPAGGEGRRTLFFHRVAETDDPLRFDAEGLYAADLRYDQAAAKVTFDTPDPLILRFVGRPIDSVRLEPAGGLVSASFQDSQVRLEPTEEGIGSPASVVVRTVDGDEFSWGPVSFVVDRSDPEFTLEEPVQDGWYRDVLPIALSYAPESGIERLEWSLDGGERQVLALEQDEARPELRRAALPFPGTDGGRLLSIRAVDGSGRSTEISRSVNRDTEAPSGAMVLPPEGASVNGRISLSARFLDSGRMAYLEFSSDGGSTWERGEERFALSRTVDLGAAPADTAPADASSGDPAGPPAAAASGAADEAQAAVPDVSRFRFRAVDAAGNSAELSAAFPVDAEADKPRVAIQLPEEGEVLRSDFAVSGAVFDDDGVVAVHYRIGEGEFLRLAVEGNSFSIPLSLADSEDNEHTVEIYGEDMYGVLGDRASRTFRISKEEPKAAVLVPALDTTVRGVIDVSGTASDANGIEGVELSFDNAVTFNRVAGTEAWTYRLDTRNLKDGLHSVYLRPADRYGTTGFYAALISVDNTPPEVTLDLPSDLSVYRDTLPLSGRLSDAVALHSCEAVVFRRGAQGDADLRSFTLPLEPVVSEVLDLAGLPDGEYGVRIVARDRAGNETVSSRDFLLDGSFRGEYIALSSPVRGERLSGKLRIQGFLRAAETPSAVAVYAGDREIVSGAPRPNGWFSLDVPELALAEGPHSLTPRFVSADGRVVEGETVDLIYAPTGPWIQADTFESGDYVPARPWLRGRAGWAQGRADAEREALELAALPKEGDRKKAAADLRSGRAVEAVELSLDNGRTFRKAQGAEDWKFRLETPEYPQGPLPLVVRVRLKNGETAVTRPLLNLDKTPPSVAILAPAEGGRFNGTLPVYGIASDDVELDSVRLALRDGDKAGYEVPAFIQGLYLEGGFLGDTMYNGGLGLTFFDDTVKLQVSYGSTPEEYNGVRQRFFGNVVSGKLLANVATLPFSYLLGPDWSFLSANLAVGAKFSYFSETSSGTPLMLSSVVAQLEFPKFTLAKLDAFSSYSLYTEFQAWFISAEVDGGVAFRLSMGARVGVF